MISTKIRVALSTRVSCLIILLAMAMPFFSMWTYPEEDWSMHSWMQILETIGSRDVAQVDEHFVEFEKFYLDTPYYPYKCICRFPGAVEQIWTPSSDGDFHGAPVRQFNILQIKTAHIKCEFNFKVPNQLAAWMNMLLI